MALVSAMSDPFIVTRYRTDCYRCKQDADQIITAVPNRSQVVCDNCGATRVFVPRNEDVDTDGHLIKIGKFPVWRLVVDAACRHCRVTGPHDLFVSTRNLVVRCRHCSFTHLYGFDLEYMAKEDAAD